MSSRRASFCSLDISDLYLWANVNNDWCHKTGSSLESVWNLENPIVLEPKLDSAMKNRFNLPNEMVNNSVDDSIRQRVLFVEKHADENRVGARVLHLGNFKKCRR